MTQYDAIIIGTGQSGPSLAKRLAGEGWTVAIHPPGGQPCAVLRNTVPSGLAILIEEAKQQVDRRLDGADWQREP